MQDSFFRILADVEEEEFRQWARRNWTAATEPNPLWHPAVRDEWRKLDEAHAAYGGDNG